MKEGLQIRNEGVGRICTRLMMLVAEEEEEVVV